MEPTMMDKLAASLDDSHTFEEALVDWIIADCTDLVELNGAHSIGGELCRGYISILT
jgi:hypothetical protein